MTYERNSTALYSTRYIICLKSKVKFMTLMYRKFQSNPLENFFWRFFFFEVMLIMKKKKKQLSSVYIYKLDLGLERASKDVMLSLELDIEVEGLIHSTLLRSRLRSTSSVVLFLLDIGSRSRSNSVTFRRPRLDLDLTITFTTDINALIIIKQFKSVTRIIY